MNRRSISTLAFAALLGGAASGCDNGLTGLNDNPNSPVTATPEFLFANATEAAISRAFGAGLHMDIAALWVQHYAEHRFSSEDRYQITDAAVSGHWSGFYAGPLMDFQEAIALSVAADRPNAEAMSRIMKSWTFHIVTDLWGDVGYSEALQGRDASTGSTPAFDPQAEVYGALLADLAAAQAMLEPGALGLGKADLIYDNDITKWARFANSLRLRLAMRLSTAAPTTGAAEFQDALADGVFESNDDNAVLWYIEGGNSVHPIFSYERNRDDHSVSKTILDTLQSFADPRLPVYAKPTAAGTYAGMPNGSLTQPALTAISKIGEFYSRADAPALVMTYAEVLFLQAEAAERGWITADAGALYEAGIRAAMETVGVGTTAIDTYLAQARVQYQGGAAGLEQIGLQKWLALYGNSVEAYAEYRRTGVPELLPGPDALNGGLIPARLPYPTRESALNDANLQAAIERQGGASLNDPIWWMRP